MRRQTRPGNFDEEVIHCLSQEMIPTWEYYGTQRLLVSAQTRSEFEEQPLPKVVRVWDKKPEHQSSLSSPKRSHRKSRILEAVSEEDQMRVRFPDLIYIRSGETEMQFGDYIVSCPEGHFILLRPDVMRPGGETSHLQEPFEGKQCEIWWFHSQGYDGYVALSVCYSQADKHINSGHYYMVKERLLGHLFHIFAQEVLEKPEEHEKTSFALLQSFLTFFTREIKAGRFDNRGSVEAMAQSVVRSGPPIEMAKEYIEKNLNYPITIDIVARAAFMTRTNFIREFKAETGQTFREYLTQRRLAEAQYWLLQDTCPIEAVGKLIGLKHSRFHELFLERFGMTPAQFRNSKRMTKSGKL
jgi:AraC-like DNA-binding protein